MGIECVIRYVDEHQLKGGPGGPIVSCQSEDDSKVGFEVTQMLSVRLGPGLTAGSARHVWKIAGLVTSSGDVHTSLYTMCDAMRWCQK